MTKTQFLSRLWTDAVAYVALLVGSGLSIAGNVADTFRTRGAAVDTLDIVMAVAWPALVVLMVEIFVSRRWDGLKWPMQILRWTGTLAIGGMAMRVSWVHLNDLMASRGQEQDVAAIGPLAIDALAIMATALILAGRKKVATPAPVDTPPSLAMQDQATVDSMAAEVASQYADLDAILDKHGVTTDVPSEADMAKGLAMLEDLANAEPLPQRRSAAARGVMERNEVEAAALITAGLINPDLTALEVDEFLAGYYGTSTRTVRRFREARGMRPVSAPPAS